MASYNDLSIRISNNLSFPIHINIICNKAYMNIILDQYWNIIPQFGINEIYLLLILI